ncbi:carbamoyl-phosphate synthase (glutamine-hydrolyzing) large subunit [Candidatus Woesearchaeota archaeon]|nr:carbamoyl-phosphate synthase (glutamine-hydrolyzing) large subunit [Candidatus Woesearchaeota archaeon]
MGKLAVKHKIKKALVIGSGALSIGQGGEFDYSGSQCLKALKEEGIKTILINPNIATIQSSKGMADKIYFLPVTPYFVEKIIKKEKPDSIMLAFGGQTALNCGVELHDSGILKKHKIKVLGTQVETIKDTEDRELFIKRLSEIDVKVAESKAVKTIKEGLKIAKKIKYPIMARAAYALGGKGSGVAHNDDELKELLAKSFAYSPQILIEKYLGGWKEIEYEVVRDSKDNCITVCNMENFDPMGIHTGESIVIAPSQTLTNSEYHKLREIAIRVIRHLGIVGECNIQYALDPESEDYRVIEVNARLSRSSALASKATGYPLAFIAAKLGLGYSLTDLDNSITKTTKACFEPALDYVVVKIPRWDLEKFRHVSQKIGSEMKSVGEVMAIGRKFEEALQKALRMLGTGIHGITCNSISLNKNLGSELKNPTDKRILAVAESMKKNYSIEKIHSLSKIDKWFLHKIKNIVDTEKLLSRCNEKNIPKELLRHAKQLGFSDFQIARLVFKNKKYDENVIKVRTTRKKQGIIPYVKQIDTLAAEYPAKTNYLYMTYNGSRDDIKGSGHNSVIVLGSGVYRIGSSVEFDWCCVNAVLASKKLKYNTIMINYNPETVSTDYDICSKLYFEEMSLERVLDIYEKELPHGVMLAFGGQIPNNLAMKLHRNHVKILGTNPLNIDNAEDRHKFSKLCDDLDVDQPAWTEVTTVNAAERFAEKVSYPILIRPSYVLSGAAMAVASDKKDLDKYLEKAAEVSKEHPVVLSKFITGAKEIEMDAVAYQGDVLIYAVSEHIENAGIHSGDATMVLPPQFTYLETIRKVKETAKKLSKALQITGPFNMQFIAKENEIKVIECNLRSSRSFPFVSKVTKHNFIDIATKAMLGSVKKEQYNTIDLDYVGVKAPQFSFSRLQGADPISGVEMASTGEVACLGKDVNDAFLKALLSVGYKIPQKSVLLSTGPIKNKAYLLDSAKKLKEMDLDIFATKGTYEFLKKNGVKAKKLFWPLEKKEPNILSYLKSGKIDLVINIPKNFEELELNNDYLIRRKAVDFNIPLITNAQNAKMFIESISKLSVDDLEIKDWESYE